MKTCNEVGAWVLRGLGLTKWTNIVPTNMNKRYKKAVTAHIRERRSSMGYPSRKYLKKKILSAEGHKKKVPKTVWRCYRGSNAGVGPRGCWRDRWKHISA